MNASVEILQNQIAYMWENFQVIPVLIEVSVDVWGDLYHFRPSNLDGVRVVIDFDMLPRRAISHYWKEGQAAP